VIALWNYVSPGAEGAPITLALRFPDGARTIRLQRLDASHGDVRGEYAQMGSPQYPTREQLEALRSSSALGAPEELSIVNHQVSITLPPNGLATAEVSLR
jgi:xylan 1,4-beta-xylosidase